MIITTIRRILILSLALNLSGITLSQGIIQGLSADNIKIINYNDEHGLSSKYAFCMLQDSYGYLWFGTQIGLNRFDGYEFISFSTNNQDSTSLPHDRIWSVFEDQSKRIWICTEGGLSLYNRATKSFTSYLPDPGNP